MSERTATAEPDLGTDAPAWDQNAAVEPDTGASDHELLMALEAVRAGDFSVRLPGGRAGIAGRIADVFNDIAAANAQMADQLKQAGIIIGRQGDDRHRVRLGTPVGAWADMENWINSLVDDLLRPTTESMRVNAALAQGEMVQAVDREIEGRPLQGVFLDSADITNTMIRQLGALQSELRRVAFERDKNEQIAGDGQLPILAGEWKELSDRVNCAISDLSAQVRGMAAMTEAQLSQSERGRSLALAAGGMGSWTYHVCGRHWEWDDGHNEIFGLKHSDSVNRNFDMRDLLAPRDRAGLETALETATPEKNIIQTEIEVHRRDGESRTCFIVAAATFDEGDQIERVDGVTVDITDRKEIERVQQILALEVDHRARNALANVQAIMRLTKAKSLDEYSKKVERRVHALAHAHELLSNARWRGADICHIVHDEMALYEAGRTFILGPSVILAPEKAQALALALHELATNAVKYGALSTSRGQIGINWTFEDNVINFEWVESGGPPVSRPVNAGFGMRIIQTSFDQASGDTAAFMWNGAGLHCTLAIHCGASSGAAKDRPAS